MSWPRYAMITEGSFMRLSADKQMELVTEAVTDTGVDYSNKNAAQRWASVRRAQKVRREDTKVEPRARRSEPTITAAEVNDWLRTLPPVPFAC